MKFLFQIIIIMAVLLTTIGAVSAENHIANGGFETPVVTVNSWNIFPSGTSSLEWTVEWFGGSTMYQGITRPDIANLELQKTGTVSGRTAYEGGQYAELDTDWKGPTNSLAGEPANVKITQTISTIPGNDYIISWHDGCRPGESQCNLGLIWNGADSGSTYNPPLTGWQQRTVYLGTATGIASTVGFVDKGTPNSLGVLLDDVKLEMAGIEITSSCPTDIQTDSSVVIAYTVKNSGDIPLDTITVDDGLNPAPELISNGDGDSLLSPQEIWTYKRTIDTTGMVQYEVTATGRYSDTPVDRYVSGTDNGTCDLPLIPLPEFPLGVVPAFILGITGLVLFLKDHQHP